MASKNIVGTIQKVVLAGVTYRVAADADAAHGKPQYKNEVEQTTGGGIRKMTLQNDTVESVSLKVNADELAQLKALAESTDDITMSYVTMAGDTYRTTGFIDYESASTMTGKLDIKMFPTAVDGWVLF
jgi:hypothetical protein